jgi:RNA polymerase sigma-70 factor (ECF subfamily)
LKDSAEITKLVAKCKQKNSKAQLKIYNLYYKAMYNTAYRIVNNFDDAEDVMQEAFIKAFNKLNSFKQQSTFGAWLKRIVINESLSWIKNKKTISINSLENLEQIEIVEEQIEIDITNQNIQNILNAIRTLKENQRVAITLQLIEGYDYEEISQIMQLSYANVRTLVSRAKAKLREKISINYEKYY